MKAIKLTLPEFLLAEFPIKNGTPNDIRQFIVHKGISLIEVISLDEMTEMLNDKVVKKQFEYVNSNGYAEKYTLAFHTNNALAHGIYPKTLLNNAWHFYKQYLQWEDNNIDNIRTTKLN